MSASNTATLANGEATESVTARGPSSPTQCRSIAIDNGSRVAELELENSRLHRLVAELLIKNQQLRKQDEI
jgi:hypothetical protein